MKKRCKNCRHWERNNHESFFPAYQNEYGLCKSSKNINVPSDDLDQMDCILTFSYSVPYFGKDFGCVNWDPQ